MPRGVALLWWPGEGHLSLAGPSPGCTGVCSKSTLNSPVSHRQGNCSKTRGKQVHWGLSIAYGPVQNRKLSSISQGFIYFEIFSFHKNNQPFFGLIWPWLMPHKCSWGNKAVPLVGTRGGKEGILFPQGCSRRQLWGNTEHFMD